jgi:predicted RNase H-like nuclease (RuvC/YqgF family)
MGFNMFQKSFCDAHFQGNLLKYEKEIDRLKNKLKWYAENQELLDRDANKMKHQEDTIYRLKQKLDSVQSEV